MRAIKGREFDTSPFILSPFEAERKPVLLDRAFTGELVPQNPQDEPVEKLLEGIRSGQNNPPKPGKRK